MALTNEELQMYNNFCHKVYKEINSNKPSMKKSNLKIIENIVRKEDNICNNNHNINYGSNYCKNSYSSNNVQIIGNNNNSGSVCSLF